MAYHSNQNNDADPFAWLNDPLGTQQKQTKNKKQTKNLGPTINQLQKKQSPQQVQQNINFNDSGWNNNGWDDNFFNDSMNNSTNNTDLWADPFKESTQTTQQQPQPSQSNAPLDLNFLFGDEPEQKTDSKNNYDKEVVDELFNLGYGSKKEIISASKLVVNNKDINAVADKVKEIQFESDEKKNNDSDDVSDDNDLISDFGTYPKVTKKWKGYTKKKHAETNGYCLSPMKDMNDKETILYLSMSTRGNKNWANRFSNEELGFDPDANPMKTKLHDAVCEDKTIKCYYHNKDPDNEPLLADFGGKYKIFLYLQTDELIAETKKKDKLRAEKKKRKQDREWRKWNRDYNGPAWNCWCCYTRNTTRTCSHCYICEKENRTPNQEDIDEFNKLKLKLKEIQSVNSKEVETFCFKDYICDTNIKGIEIKINKKKEKKQFIIKDCGNKMSHVVGEKGFNKGRHSLKFKYPNMEKYPKTFFDNIWRVCLTNKCEEDKSGDLFGYRGEKSMLFKFSGKTKEVIFSVSESGMGFEMGKFWNSEKKIDKNRKYNIVEIVADFDENWMFCFLNDKLTFHRWKGWGQDLYAYKLLDFPYTQKEEDGLFYWCFECCAGDWPKPITILHCY